MGKTYRFFISKDMFTARSHRASVNVYKSRKDEMFNSFTCPFNSSLVEQDV